MVSDRMKILMLLGVLVAIPGGDKYGWCWRGQTVVVYWVCEACILLLVLIC